MTIFNKTFSDFSGGMVSARKQMQFGSETFDTIAETIENFQITSQGILLKRNGFKRIKKFNNVGDDIKLIVFSGNLYLFYKKQVNGEYGIYLKQIDIDKVEGNIYDYPNAFINVSKNFCTVNGNTWANDKCTKIIPVTEAVCIAAGDIWANDKCTKIIPDEPDKHCKVSELDFSISVNKGRYSPTLPSSVLVVATGGCLLILGIKQQDVDLQVGYWFAGSNNCIGVIKTDDEEGCGLSNNYWDSTLSKCFSIKNITNEEKKNFCVKGGNYWNGTECILVFKTRNEIECNNCGFGYWTNGVCVFTVKDTLSISSCESASGYWDGNQCLAPWSLNATQSSCEAKGDYWNGTRCLFVHRPRDSSWCSSGSLGDWIFSESKCLVDLGLSSTQCNSVNGFWNGKCYAKNHNATTQNICVQSGNYWNGTNCLTTSPDITESTCIKRSLSYWRGKLETFIETDALVIDETPKLCEFHKGRLWLSGFTKTKNRIIASSATDFKDFIIPSTIIDSSPLDMVLTDINEIKFLLSGKELQIGHDKGISIIGSSGVISTADSFLKLQTTVPVGEAKPINFNNGFVYTSLGDLDLYYSEYSRGVSSWETTILTKKINNKEMIKEIHVYQNQGEKICCLLKGGDQLHYSVSIFNSDMDIGAWAVSKNLDKLSSIFYDKTEVENQYGLISKSTKHIIVNSYSENNLYKDDGKGYKAILKTFNINDLWPIGIKNSYRIMLKIYGETQNLKLNKIDYKFKTKIDGEKEYMSLTKSFIGYSDDTNIEIISESDKYLEIIGISVRGVVNEP